MTRTGGCCSNQYSHPSWKCIGNGRGADEPWGTAAHRLPNRCQPLSEWALQLAATRGAGRTACFSYDSLTLSTPRLLSCHFFCLWLKMLQFSVWFEPRGTECSRGDAVSRCSAEWGAWYQRPSGSDRATDRLSLGLHQHGPRQPQQVHSQRAHNC